MNKCNLFLAIFILIVSPFLSSGQAPIKLTSADIQAKMQKLNFLGSVLYIAAHPDDENTRLISYMANGKKAETAYLSLTRGDGGQNLIGTEIQEQLGVLRTQELLAARRIDGGKQFFSRANDFGYSKHPDETFEIWNKKEVLSDVVLTIRKFQPDIIINRFDHRSPGTTHGHHTGSAMLGLEAFDLSNDKNSYPEQLTKFAPFQANRIFFNTSWWFYGSEEKFAEADKTNLYTFDVGVYFPLKGKSNNEIAAESRSQHKCQGFGSTGVRGEQTEYVEWLAGNRPENKDDIFDGINTTWSRLKNGEEIGKLVANLEKNFDSNAPYKSLDALIVILSKIENLEKSVWKDRKMEECQDLIFACSGFYLDAYTADRTTTPEDSLKINIEMINRSPANIQFISYSDNISKLTKTLDESLLNNKNFKSSTKILIPENTEFSSSYWLRENGTLGMYAVKNKDLIGLPESPDPINITFQFKINNHNISVTKPVVFKTGDPVKGEIYDPLEILSPVFVETKEETVIFKIGQKKIIKFEVTAGKDKVAGMIKPCFGKNWIVNPTEIPFSLDFKNEKKYFEIEVTAPNTQDVSKMNFIAEVNGNSYTDKLVKIEYDHIPTQLILRPNDFNVISIPIESIGNNVAYIMGGGDKVPDALRAIGYNVTELKESEIREEVLRNYGAVIVGIRAYNTIENMKFYHKALMDYVEKGGTVVVQYNTNRGINSDMTGPYPMKLSRDRVTDEFAEVRILAPNHPVMNYPNKITEKDFEGWIQERGLYFPSEWDEKYVAILSSNDKDSEALDGGLLVTEYGSGHFIYTGYSFFRELPAGVPGAFRLFANLISYGQETRP